MKVIRRNGDIPIDMLYPHPDNPRRDVGDVTELAESIKANGIFQNLTVIYGGKGVEEAHPGEDVDGYTVIIGHRRLAAAKLAGLTKVPCLLAEMDEKEQISTMLLENMQRSDLTVYEQAQGFQMMLDLGETQDSISEKTGFSKTTVRHRLKLLELDPEEFRKAEERQPKFTDYIELEKITDPELKSKALAAIGTANFDWVVKNAVETEQKRRYEAEWREYVKDLGTEVKYEDKNNYTKQGFFYTRNELTDKVKEKIAAFEKPLYYCSDSYGYVYMLNERSQSEEPKHETEPEWKIEAHKRKAKKARIIETEDMAQALRLGFVKGYSRRNGMTALLIELIWEEMELDTVDWAYVAELCGVKFECEEDEDISAEDFAQNSDIVYMLLNSPAKALLAIIAAYLEKSIYDYVSLHDYSGDYKKNAILEHWYATLQKLGYSMSDEERALLDGTHECFKDEEKI